MTHNTQLQLHTHGHIISHNVIGLGRDLHSQDMPPTHRQITTDCTRMSSALASVWSPELKLAQPRVDTNSPATLLYGKRRHDSR